jgi:hypothetical protein
LSTESLHAPISLLAQRHGWLRISVRSSRDAPTKNMSIRLRCIATSAAVCDSMSSGGRTGAQRTPS